MYRLLIVDDEAIITDGLYEVFQKQDLDLDLCKAYSGVEAIETMKRLRVDIVLTDIRMPDLDGMQLMKHIETEWPHCKIIFLTGYNDFEYVYKAIQRNGVRYILKNEGYRKVISAVHEVVDELNSDLQVSDLIQRSREQWNTLEVLLQGEYVRHLIHGTRSVDEMQADFMKLNIPLDPNQPYIAVLGVMTGGLRDSHVSRQEAGLAVKFLAESYLKDKVNQVGVLDRYHDLLWLMQPREGADRSTSSDVRSLLGQLEGAFEWIEHACADSLELDLSFTMTGHLMSWDELPLVYDQLRHLQSFKVGDGARLVQVVQMKETSFSRQPPVRSILEHAELMAVQLERGRRDDFLEGFDRLVNPVLDGENMTPAMVMELYHAIALVLLSYMNRMNLSDPTSLNSLLHMNEHPSWPERFAMLRQTAEWLFEQQRNREKNRASHAIDQVCAHIENHLDQDLSLVRLSSLIHFNPSYLSRLFKQERGVKLSEYIEQQRLKRAKELLKEQSLKILEVGAKVGYESPHSFTRFFKKATGMTPQDFRDGIRDMENVKNEPPKSYK